MCDITLYEAYDLDAGDFRLFENLERLSIGHSRLYDIQFVTIFKELSHLSLNFNHIKEIRPVLVLPYLSRLNLSHNEISAAPGLSPLGCLKKLDMSFNQLSDLNFLDGVETLERLDMKQNHIYDLSILAELKTLTELDARANPVQSVEPLLALPCLEHVYLPAPLCEDMDIIYINTKKIFSNGKLSVVENKNYGSYWIESGGFALPDVYREMIYTLLHFRRYDTVIEKTKEVYKAACNYDFTENRKAYEWLLNLPVSRFKSEMIAWLQSRPALKLPEYVDERHRKTPGKSGSLTFYPIEGGGFLGGDEPYTVGRYQYKEVQPYRDWGG